MSGTTTQAQIEAAAKAIEEIEEFGFLAINSADAYQAAKAALTAAAEVGEQTHLVSEIHRQHKEIERLKIQVIERDSAIAGWIKREAATIERCAHAVKEILDRTYNATAKERLEAAIAAIRALKDKP